MPIRSFLSDQAFDSETTDAMSQAFTDACSTLGLVDRDDPITRLVAQYIIELAGRGIRSKGALYGATMDKFKANPL